MTLKLKTGGIISQLFCLLIVLDFFMKNIMIIFIGYIMTYNIYIIQNIPNGFFSVALITVNKKIEYRAQIVHFDTSYQLIGWNKLLLTD